MFWRRKALPPENQLATRVATLEARLGEMLELAADMTSVADKLFAMEKRWQKRDRDEARRADEPAPNGPAAEPLNPMALRLLARGGKG